MGPQLQSFSARIRRLPILSDSHRRQKALKLLQEKGFEEFAYYVVGHNVPLFYPGGRRHKVRTKEYLLRKEDYYDSVLVKAILHPSISSEDIYKMMQHDHMGRLKCLPNLTSPANNFINVYSSNLWDSDLLPPTILDTVITYSTHWRSTKDNTIHGPYGETIIYKGPRGARGIVGPGDDGYGGSWCGADPCVRQYLHDPYDLLMALFIRGDTVLIDNVLNLCERSEVSLKTYLPGALELFLIDKAAQKELHLINKYIKVPWAYDYAKFNYGDGYKFLKGSGWRLYRGCAYCVDPGLWNIWA